MNRNDTEKQQLINEVNELRKRISELEKYEKEHIRIEHSLHIEEECSRGLIDHSHDLFFCVDKSGIIRKAGGRNLPELQITPHEIIGQSVYELFPPEMADTIRRHQSGVFETGQNLTCEHSLDSAGLKKHGLFTFYPIKSPEDEVELVGIICRSFTYQKQIEHELTQEKNIFTTLIDQSPFCIAIYDADGHFIRGNRAFHDLIKFYPPPDYSLFEDKIFLRQPYFRELMKKLKKGEIIKIPGIEYNIHELFPEFPDIPMFFSGIAVPISNKEKKMEFLAVMFENVTRQVKTEQALQESERSFRSITENIQDIVFNLQAEPLKINHISSLTTAITGYTPEEFYNNPRLIFEIVHPDDRKKFESIFKLSDSVHKQIEIRLNHKNGTVVWIELRYIPVIDDGGNLIGLEGVARDISQRKLTEKILRENEKKLLEIIDGISISLIIIGKNHKITHWNKACEKMTGIAARDVIGTNKQWKAFYADERPIMADLIVDGGQPDGFSKYYSGKFNKSSFIEEAYEADDFFPDLGKNGKWLFFTAAPLKDAEGNITGAVETLQDITERKLAEIALKEQLIFLQTLMDTIPNPIFYKSVNGLYMGCNKAFKEFMGFDGDILGKTVFDIAPRDLALIYNKMDVQLFNNPGIQTYEGDVIHADGTKRNAVFYKATFGKSDGTVMGLVGVIVDITDSKRLETQLRQAQKMESIGTLASGIAHDFNNILAAILGNTELALLSLPDESPVHEELEQVIKSTGRAKDLVTQILTFSRQTNLEKQPIPIANTIKEALRMLRSMVPTSIEIVQNILSIEGYVFCDPVQIHQILMNLCNNAAYAMKNKPGIMKISLEDLDIDEKNSLVFNHLPHGRYLKLSVSDTGTGIDVSIQEKLFDPFFTTKAPGEGSGLGLSVVHGIVKDLNGAITYESKPGEGSNFHVILPRIEHVMSENHGPVENIRGGNERILIVDDEREVVVILEKILKELGYMVTLATSSVEALDIFSQQPDNFDVIISDITMPKMTGIELAGKIIEIRPDIPIILCTGYNEYLSEHEKIRFDAILKKPFRRSDIAQSLRNIFEKK
ncbi:PAS domain S-box protein [bacterium]|nr:PAS domain S-box protein [bacterium]